MQTWPLQLRLEPRPESARIARMRVVATFGLRGRLAETLGLLVSEAVAHSVVHAGLGPEDRIVVRASCDAERVRVEVCDEGGPIDHRATPALSEGGRGLALISALSHRCGLQHDGTTRLWFELLRDGEDTGASPR